MSNTGTFATDALILAGKKKHSGENKLVFAVRAVNKCPSNLLSNFRAVPTSPGLRCGSLVLATCAPVTGCRHRCSDRGVGEASAGASRQRRGSGRRWGETHERTAQWWRLLPWWPKWMFFGCPWDVSGGIADVAYMMCFTPVTSNPPLTSQKHFFIIQNMIRIFFSNPNPPLVGEGQFLFLSQASLCEQAWLFYLISCSSSFAHCCLDFLRSLWFSHQHQPSTCSFSFCLRSASFTHVMLFIRITSSYLTGSAA